MTKKPNAFRVHHKLLTDAVLCTVVTRSVLCTVVTRSNVSAISTADAIRLAMAMQQSAGPPVASVRLALGRRIG